jgi:hypothetical protein
MENYRKQQPQITPITQIPIDARRRDLRNLRNLWFIVFLFLSIAKLLARRGFLSASGSVETTSTTANTITPITQMPIDA